MNAVASPLRVLIVDDEAPARLRLRDLLGDIAAQVPTRVIGMAANGVEALRLLEQIETDVVLADISMPAMNGVEFARHAAARPRPPAVIFTTAHDEYAIQAFDVAATDYLLKPVRAERLAAALARVRHAPAASADDGGRQHFSVIERGRILFLSVDEVLYLRAELKYVTARTVEREYLLSGTLVQIEQAHPERFLRIHRNCLVARAAIAGVRRRRGGEGGNEGEGEGETRWEILLHGLGETLPVSRRQWPQVKQALAL
ncbi:MAG: LytTR family DNA-binding domain-containing protein [Azoarcus sp.]|jgi:two-component system response regulator AlgR|nr:LytTR family DNA-binding domain-containing protein [Azoarcus sp.]